jgi:hypothetical protein
MMKSKYTGCNNKNAVKRSTNIMFLDIIHRLKLGTSSIDWAQLSRFYLKMETESSLRNVVF